GEQTEKLPRFFEVGLQRILWIDSKTPAVRQQPLELFGYSRTGLSRRRLLGIGTIRNGVEGGEPYSDSKRGRNRPDALNDLSQEARTVFEASAVIALTRMRTQELMPQISVTMFDVDEIESYFRCDPRSAMKRLDDLAHVAIGYGRVVAIETELLIENRMMIDDPGLGLPFPVWCAVTSGMRQLKADYQTSSRTCCALVLVDKSIFQRGETGASLI